MWNNCGHFCWKFGCNLLSLSSFDLQCELCAIFFSHPSRPSSAKLGKTRENKLFRNYMRIDLVYLFAPEYAYFTCDSIIFFCSGIYWCHSCFFLLLIAVFVCFAWTSIFLPFFHSPFSYLFHSDWSLNFCIIDCHWY